MTSQFLTPLILRDDGGFPMTLVKALAYRSASLNRVILVPAGFRTDLASIPRGLWNVLPKVGRWDKAAVVHDYLYAHNGVTRAQADHVLREACEALGVGRFTRTAIWLGVRAGGWKPWGDYRKAADHAGVIQS